MQDHFELTPAQWQTLRALLDEAMAREGDDRARWLASLAGEQAAFRPRLEALLLHAHGSTAQAVLETLPRVETAQFAPAPPPAERVGPYRLIRELGSGGMASVWLAERTDMLQGRQVALKLPHGAWKRAGLAERLQREREILATLEHPNIARLYDAGVADDGQPWLALEYVAGERIDAWCERHAPDVPARLRLFLQVARAVAHAHANLVVHRDLKPSNILVTGAGEVKLLDFGIAKLLDQGVAHETELTQQAGRALTPDYAAPEQILGRPIGTAADVYALGVVLYELLTGLRPYALRRDSRSALEDAIIAADVEPPSARVDARRRRALRGDLDTIVLKALRKEPSQRYPTVAALAEDVERCLRHEPIIARRAGVGYRVGRFVRRNWVAVSAVSAIAVSLLVGALAAAWQASVARSEAQAARRALRMANANVTLADFFVADLAAQRSTTDLVAQIERAVLMVRSQYRDDALVRGRLLGDLGARLRRIGEWERYRAVSAEAEQAAVQAGDAELAAQLACRRARDVVQGGDLAEGRRIVAGALASLEPLHPPPDATLVGCLAEASAIARTGGDAREALRTAQRIVAIETAAGITHSATHADSLLILARAQGLAGRYADAVRSLQAGLALHERLGTAQTPGANHLHMLMAGMLGDGGRPQAGLEIVERLLAEHERRGGERRTVATVVWQRGLCLLALGQHDRAQADLAAALADARASGDRSLVRASIVALVTALARGGRLPEAQAHLAEASSLFAQPLAQRSYNARLLLFAQAELALAQGDAALAATAIETAAEIVALRATIEGDAAARTLEVLRARLALAEGRRADALRHAGAALALSRRHAIDAADSVQVGEDRALLDAAQALPA